MALTHNPDRTAATTVAGQLDGGLGARLQRLRRALWRRSVVAALGHCLWIGVALATAHFVLDILFSFERTARGILAAVWALVFLAAALRAAFLVRRSTPSLVELAHQVERRFPELQGLLVNAVEWSGVENDLDGRGLTNGVSIELMLATRHRAEIAASSIDFQDLLERRKDRRRIGRVVASGAVLLAGLALGLRSETVAVWAQRNLLFRDVSFPRRTRIDIPDVVDGQLVLPRGGSANVRLRITRADGASPPTPEIEFRPRRSHMLTTRQQGQERLFQLALRDVLEPFAFRVRADDARSPWIAVRLVDPPALRDLSLRAVEPRYAGGNAVPLPSGQGPYRVLRGSRLEITGHTNKRLASAVVHTGRQQVLLAVLPDSTDPQQGWFQGHLTPDQLTGGLLSFSVKDEFGLDFERAPAVRIELVDDATPEVTATWRGASRLVVPNARISWSVTAKDDRAVTRVALIARVADGEGTETRPWQPVSPPTPRHGAPTALVSHSSTLDLSELNLTPGSVLTLACEAEDNDALSGPKSGRSAERLLRVVEPGELRADWLRREKEQRQQLEQLIDDLDAWTEMLPADGLGQPEAASGADDATSRAPREDDLQRVIPRYRALAEALGDPQRLLSEVHEEIQHSGLESASGPLVERLATRIMNPLRDVREREMPRVERDLRTWQNAAARSTAATAARQSVVDGQRTVSETLRKVVRELSRAEGFQEAVRLLEELNAGQQEVLVRTLEAERRRVRELLERGKSKDDGTKTTEDRDGGNREPVRPGGPVGLQ